jgi:nicotinamide-nucleotide amidase
VQAEIVTIGTELLLGEIVDTNSAWIAQAFTTIGLNLFYTTTVGDNLQRVTQVLRAALERSDVVVTTGGLGPTVDDMTRDAVAAATERGLVLNEELLAEISCFFAKHGRGMTDNNRKQAYVPEGATVIHNPVGTAPCFAVAWHGHLIISLPGVPHEMVYLMEHAVLPLLRERLGMQGIIKSRTIHTTGIGESAVDAQIGDLMQGDNPSVGTRAHPGQTDVVITAKADSEAQAEALISPVEQAIRARLGAVVYGADREQHAPAILSLLRERGLTLATVESATQGELAQELYIAAGGDPVYAAGLVIAESGGCPLGLGAEALGAAGLGSQQAADALAERARQVTGAYLGLAVVGPCAWKQGYAPLIYYCLATPEGLVRREPRTGREGPAGRGWLRHLALELVRRHLLGLEQI